jgi:hypothetical protein
MFIKTHRTIAELTTLKRHNAEFFSGLLFILSSNYIKNIVVDTPLVNTKNVSFNIIIR